jgi:fibronectin-binding autotransporter adhesin
VPKSSLSPRRRRASFLLATTSIAALLLGAATPAQAGQAITNTTVATVTNPAGQATTSIVITGSTVSGAVANAGTITPGKAGLGLNGSTAALFVQNSSVGGGVSNTGTINANGAKLVVGIDIHGNIVAGGVSNTGTINVTTNQAAEGVQIDAASTITGDIVNKGMITAKAKSGGAVSLVSGLDILGSVTGGVINSGTIIATGNVANAIGTNGSTTIGSGYTNTGTLLATAIGDAVGLDVFGTIVAGGIGNSGTIVASGGNIGIGIVLATASPGGITNTGTIFGSTDSLQLADPTGTVVVTQAAGALIGSVEGIAPCTLNVTGGALSLQPTSRVTGLATLNQSGGNILLQVTPSNAQGQFPTVNVSSLTLSGVLEVAPQSGSFAAGQTITYANVFTGNNTLSNGITQTQVFGFFSNAVTASLTPGTGANSLSLTLTNNSGMALTPGVASGPGTFTTLTNPLGAILPAVSVTNGASVSGGIVNQGFIGNLALPGPSKTGILVSGGSLSGPIVNTGTIAGTVAAIDVSGATGRTTITQSVGTITGAIKLSANADALTINGGAIFGDIVGAGTSDTLVIDPVNNANGTFTYENTISGIATINLAANANLALTAQGVLNNSGVLTLAPTGRISGNGTFTQTASGTTALQFTNNTAAGAFPTIAANAITLSGKLQVVLTGAFPAVGIEDFVKVFAASGTLANTVSPSNVSIVTSGATLPAGVTVTAQLVQSGNSADVVITEIGFAALPGLTRNEHSVATALDALFLSNAKASQPLLNALVHANGPALTQALDALSGEVHASTVTAAFEDSGLARQAILDHLSEPVSPPPLGAASTMTGAYAADLPSGKGPRIAPVAVSLYQPRLFDVWGQGFGDWGRVKSDGNAASISRSTGGFVLGGDVSARGFMGGDWRFGLAGGYTNDRITVSQRLSSATFESVFGGAYAGASFGAVQLRAGALYATNSTSTTRQVILPGFSDATSSSNGGSTAQAFGEAGYRISLSGTSFGGLAFSRASLEPFAGAAAIRIHQNGFSEGGGIAALTGTAKDFNVETTTLGARGELAFASMPVTLTSMLAWRHAYGNVVPSVLLGFQGGAQSFGVSGIPIDRDAFVAEAGVNYAVSSMLSVGVSYSGQFGERATDNAFKGHITLSF